MATQQVERASAALAITTAYGAQTAALRERLAKYIAAVWKSLGSYGNKQMAQFITDAVPMITGAEQQMQALTAAYLTASRQAQIGGAGVPVAVAANDVTGAATRNGVSPTEVYGRPFHLVWRELHDGKDPQDAIQSGLDRAQNLAATDVQRAKQLTAQKILSADKRATSYERVLEGTHSCGLCIVASTQRYHKAKLLPIHPGCDCGIAATYDDKQILHLERLQDIHQAIEDTFGKSSAAARNIPGQWANGKPIKYRDVLVTHEHGELGPILAVKGRRFVGPGDIEKRVAEPGPSITQSMTTEKLRSTIDALERSSVKFSSAGTTRRLDELRAELAKRSTSDLH